MFVDSSGTTTTRESPRTTQDDGEDATTSVPINAETEIIERPTDNEAILQSNQVNKTSKVGDNDDGNDSIDSEEAKGGNSAATSSAAPSSDNSQAQQSLTSKDVVATAKPKPKIRIKLKLPSQAKRKLPLSEPPKDPSSTSQAKAPKKSVPLSKHVTGTGSRRRPVAPSKQVKIPPLASPGLLVPGKPSPRDIFDTAMAGAGYSTKQRAENPHRGSSVQRTVDDMFDTDVKLALHPIELVPKDLLNGTIEREGKTTKLLDLLEKSFGDLKPSEPSRTLPWRDMVPVSLTLSYPEDFLTARRSYVEKVRERERLIIDYQEAAEDLAASTDEGDPKTNPIKVPPIPDLPHPPLVEDLGLNRADFSSKTEHPVYLPAKEDLVAHLDPNCFHVTQGRYFGLLCNQVADPNVCGPNAAGFSGMSGLATATTSTTTSTSGISGGGMALILSAGFHCAAAVPLKESSSFKPLTPLAPPAPPTETANALRLLMMDDTWAEKFRLTIIKAAAYAARTEVYDTTFTGPNKLVYPDLGKAFSMYAQIKPCARCKNNKQGVYHCRIRRRHKEADFDGGSSSSSLDPYSDVPLDSLLIS